MNRYFTLDTADLIVPNQEAWGLLWDFQTLVSHYLANILTIVGANDTFSVSSSILCRVTRLSKTKPSSPPTPS
jgi:hypothetical protein